MLKKNPMHITIIDSGSHLLTDMRKRELRLREEHTLGKRNAGSR